MFPNFKSFKISIFFAFLFAILASAFIVVHIDVLISKPQSEILQEKQMLQKAQIAQAFYDKNLNGMLKSAIVLSKSEHFRQYLENRDFGGAGMLLKQAMDIQNLDIGLITDRSGLILYDPLKKGLGRQIGLNGLIEKSVKLNLPFAATEMLTSQELAQMNSNLLYDSKIRRIPSFNQIEQNELYNSEGMMLVVAVPLENSVIILAELLNRNSAFVDELAKITDSDASIYLQDVRIATTLKTRLNNRFIGILLPEPAYVKGIVLGEEHLSREWYINESALNAFVPVQNYQGNAIGLISVTKSEQALASSVVAGPQEKRMLLIALFLVSLFVSFLMALLSCAMVLPALRKMASSAEDIRKGNFEQGIKIRSFSEVNDLASSLNVMSRYLRKLLIKREREIIADLKPVQVSKMLGNLETIKQIKNVERLKTILKEQKK